VTNCGDIMNKDAKRIQKIAEQFISILKREVKKNPNNFFLEDDLRCFGYMILYGLLKKHGCLNTKDNQKEIRLRANFNPYSYHKRARHRNVAYDLAILDEKGSARPVCVVEFKFNKVYEKWGHKRQYCKAGSGGFRTDYNKLVNTTIPVQLCIFVDIGGQRDSAIDKMIKNRKVKRIRMEYIIVSG